MASVGERIYLASRPNLGSKSSSVYVYVAPVHPAFFFEIKNGLFCFQRGESEMGMAFHTRITKNKET
eukprot:scaffold19862_cov176-Cylindrotheca_fusiformis.AAC.1